MTPLKTRYFLDTEFIAYDKVIDLLSIGIVTEDGSRELYLESYEVDFAMADDFVKKNVIPKLRGIRHPRASIAHTIREFCDPTKYGKPEFWAYYADYDWVALCGLFGRMVDLPEGWPMYCLDVKQLLVTQRPFLKLPPPVDVEAHNALADAKWLRQCWIDLALGNYQGANRG